MWDHLIKFFFKFTKLQSNSLTASFLLWMQSNTEFMIWCVHTAWAKQQDNKMIECVVKVMGIKWKWISTSSKSIRFVSMSSLNKTNPNTKSKVLRNRCASNFYCIDFGANIYANHSHFFHISSVQRYFKVSASVYPFLMAKIHFKFYTIATLRAAFQTEWTGLSIDHFIAEIHIHKMGIVPIETESKAQYPPLNAKWTIWKCKTSSG